MNYNNNNIENKDEEEYNFNESNSIYNNELNFYSSYKSFPENIFKNITKEEYNNSKCFYCDQISLFSKVFKQQNDKDKIIVCYNCFSRLNKNNNFFNINSIDKESTFILKQIIGNYKVSCLNFNCKWEGTFSKLKDHIQLECQYQPIKCPNKGCHLILLKKDLNSHLMQCLFDETYIKINCNFCKNEIKKNDIENHITNCPEVIINCEKNCGTKIKRKDLEYHKAKCMEILLKCKFWDYGCKKYIKRKYMKDHEKLEIKNHYNLIKNSLNNVQIKFEKREEFNYMHNIINELKDKIKEKNLKEKEISEKNENKKIDIIEPLYNDEKKDYNLQNEGKDIKVNYKFNEGNTPFTGIPIKFISGRENILNKIIIFREEKIYYSGNYYKNLEKEKYYFVIGENCLDLTKNTNFSFRINPDPITNNYPWIALGLYDIQNENETSIDNIDNYYYQRKGLYCIDLKSNTCFDGKVDIAEINSYKLDLNTIIKMYYSPKNNLLIIKDNNFFEIFFPNIPNDNLNLRICFIFNGEDRAIIDYH